MNLNTNTELEKNVNDVVADCINRNFNEQNSKIIFEELNPLMKSAFPDISKEQQDSLRNIIWNIMRISAKLAVDSALEANTIIKKDLEKPE